MNSLADAWKWYENAKDSLQRLRRVAEKYWDAENAPWTRDNKLAQLDKAEIAGPALNALEHLDDLAVVVLFSVFESIVRVEVLEQLNRETRPAHPILGKAFEDAKDLASEGGIYGLLNAYRAEGYDVELIHQVRRYRNWVAHGRRTAQPAQVDPKEAYRRLNQFLTLFFSPLNIDETKVETPGKATTN